MKNIFGNLISSFGKTKLIIGTAVIVSSIAIGSVVGVALRNEPSKSVEIDRSADIDDDDDKELVEVIEDEDNYESETIPSDDTIVDETTAEESDDNVVEATWDETELEENCIKIVSSIKNWEATLLYRYYGDLYNKTIEFENDQMEKARLSILSTELLPGLLTTNSKLVIEKDYFQPISNTVFGSDFDINAIPAEDIFFSNSDKGVYMDTEALTAEDEGDFTIIQQDVSQYGEGYEVTQYLYCGYWGDNDGVNGNYDVVFHFEKKNDSEYGVVLTDMNFLKSDLKKASSSEYTPFYGIWCGAAKSEDSANNIVSDLNSKGLDGFVFVSSDWGNLSKDKWYVVSAGAYANEEDAKAALSSVKAAGYNDAYVKYSGEYLK